MKPDMDGFLYPEVDAGKCVNCGLCEKACPVVTLCKKQETLPDAYAAYTMDQAVRLESSSGGVFSEVAKTVIAQGGAVFGAAYNDSFEVVHICVETEPELVRLRGAKYAQSDLGNTFAQVKQRLDRGQQVLFSGTPCQVGGLKAFLRKDYENLLTVDIICHSVPSPMVWEKYVESFGKIKSFNLRAKDTGWSRYRYCHRIDSGDDIKLIPSGDSLYMKLFVGGYINRKSCENCRFKGYSRVSDLTLGDFWGIWDIAPEMDDDKGTSVVLVQSDRGAAVLNQLRDKLVVKTVTLEEASRQNPAMLVSAKPNPKRTEAMELIRGDGIGNCETWFPKPAESTPLRLVPRIRRLLARIKRKLWPDR